MKYHALLALPLALACPTGHTEQDPVPSSSDALPTSSDAVSSPLDSAPSNSTSTKVSTAAVSGQSTFYSGNLATGTCSFTTYTLPSGIFGTAFSGSAWNTAAQCGACLEVTGPDGTNITVMVVDQCPECDAGHLDLFADAFASLGPASAGVLTTSYQPVACGITSPISLRPKDGASRDWFSVQVVNANRPVAALEVSVDGGATWQAVTRTDDNFFERKEGFGADTVDVRVTSVEGGSIVVKGVSAKGQTTGGFNF